MAYFERQGALLSFNQLTTEIRSHYTTQAVQQAYVFILGLDVLGNPYGLIKDFTQGLGDFFYEPFMVSPEKYSPPVRAKLLLWTYYLTWITVEPKIIGYFQ